MIQVELLLELKIHQLSQVYLEILDVPQALANVLLHLLVFLETNLSMILPKVQ